MLIRLIHALLLATILSACGGGGGGSSSSSSGGATVSSNSVTISIPPAPQTVIAGQNATFTVTATGSPSLTYQWLKNGTAILGATSSSYTTPVTLGDSGSLYSVVVSSGLSASVTSTFASLTVQASSLNKLVISEVSTCLSYSVDCWFEIYNPTSATVNLSNYLLNASSVNASTGVALGAVGYTLPSYSLPPDGYVVITGNARNAAQHGSQSLRIRTGNNIPSWGANGFVELQSAGATVDFVKFGTSTQAPATPSAWSGSAVAALPFTALDYGKSIVRMYPAIASVNTHTAADWTLVSFSTAAGRNDVPASAQDLDGDGIPNTAKVAGGTYAGIDLYSMGAQPGRRDIFIEVDFMTSADPGVRPRAESLQKVVDAFAPHGIAIHFDAGTLFSSSFSIANFNLGQTDHTRPYEPCVTFDEVTCTSNISTRRSLYDWKEDFMDLRRRSFFHYLLFGNSQLAGGGSGSSGLAELPGNDFMVTMGAWGFTTGAGIPLNFLINQQAGTVMHELGHNLGLMHGGFENTNWKPNYWSVMNYIYQLQGLDGNPSGSSAYQRWKLDKLNYNTSSCVLANSVCGAPSQFIIDYSNGSSIPLSETSLLESNNIGRGSTGGAYADWNLDGVLSGTALIQDLNKDGAKTVLLDNNDWASLILPFNRYSAGNSGISQLSISPQIQLNAISDDRQPVAEEQAPSPAMFNMVRNAH